MAREFNKKKSFKKTNSGGKKRSSATGRSEDKAKPFAKFEKKSSFNPNADLENSDESYSERKRKNLLSEDRKSGEEKSAYGKKKFGRGFDKSEGNKGFKRKDEDAPQSYTKKTFDKKGFGKPERTYGDKPFGSNPFKRKEEDLNREEDNTPSFKRRPDARGEKPRVPGKPLRSSVRKPFDKSDEKRSFDKPAFKGRDDEGKKPFRKSFDKSSKREDTGYKKRDEEREERPQRSFDKPARSTDRPTRSKEGEVKPYSGKPLERKPFEKRPFDKKPFDKKPGNNYTKKGSYDPNNDLSEGSERPFGRDEESRSERPDKKKFKTPYERKPLGAAYKKMSPHQAESSSSDGLIRLNKYISNAGICSRREADELIQAGAVKVNGVIVTEMGYKVKLDDVINYGGETLRKEKLVYVLLNKPKDFITTLDDPGNRKTVFDLVKNACKERIYPVGRLDRNTTGVLLLTNDGELTKKLTHPKHGIKKIYQATLDKPMSKPDMDEVAENGITLEDGFIKPDVMNYVGDGANKKEVGLEIHSGRNRIVRRMFEHLGYEVVKLDRVVFAGLTKKDLPRGNWRLLSEKEVGYLKMLGV